MALNVELKIGENSLLYQQNTDLHMKLKNAGSRALTVQTSAMDPSVPVVRVVNLVVGGEREYKRSHTGERSGPGFSQDLQRGETVEDRISLLDVVDDLPPAEYDISVVWPDEDGGRAESPPVRLKVLPATPKNLCLADAMGGSGNIKMGVWVNLAQEPFTLVRSTFMFQAGLTVITRGLGVTCAAACRPVISAPSCQEALSNHWIAWIDGDDVAFIHACDDLGVSKERRFRLAARGATIVGPLHGEPVEDDRVRPDGAALICYPGGAQFALQTVELNPKKATAGTTARVSGPAPLWMHSHVRTTGKRLVTYAQTDGGKVSLHTRSWPGSEGKGEPPPTWGEWPAELLGAAAAMDQQDGLHGAFVLLEGTEEAGKKLTLLTWSVSGGNEFAEVSRQNIDWHPGVPIRGCTVGVSDAGTAAALLRDDEETWKVYDGRGNLGPVPGEFHKTVLPFEVGFLHGSADPLLLCGRLSRGFQILDLQGNPLPRVRIK